MYTHALCTCIIYLKLKNSFEDQVVLKFTKIHKICKGYPEKRERDRARMRARERRERDICIMYA